MLSYIYVYDVLITGYNGDIPESFSVGLSQISIKTTFTQYS